MNDPVIVLVEDEPEILKMLAEKLSEHHFKVLTAARLQDAKILVEQPDVQLVISDLALPDGSGIDLLKYIRCIRPSLPVIITTGFPSIHVVEEALRLGAFDLVEKPFDVQTLISIVSEAFALRLQQGNSLKESLAILGKPAVFIDSAHRVLSKNLFWQQIVDCKGSCNRCDINLHVDAASPLTISDLLSGIGASDTVRAQIGIITNDGIKQMTVVAVPVSERRDQPGGFLLTFEENVTEADTAIYNDPLTACLNHRGFFEALANLRQQALRQSTPVSLLVVDIDGMGSINRTQGYDLGDKVLGDLAEEIRRIVRSEDIVGRYGGDEFIIALRETYAAEAMAAAHRLMAALDGDHWQCEPLGVPISITIGVVECPSGYTIDNRELANRAHLAMQYARRQGKNRVLLYRDEMSQAGDGPIVEQERIERLTRQFAQVNEKLKATYIESARALVAAVEAKDPYTRRHSEAVAYYACQIASEMDLPEAYQRTLRYAAALHDVGKIGIPDEILTRPGNLTDEEYQLIKQHPTIGANIVSHVSCMRREVPLVQHHHENWDGSGYPAGLQRSAIPLGARILRVADSLDAMLSNRSYRQACTWEYALNEIYNGSGRFYDPRIVEAVRCLAEKLDEKLVVRH